MISIDKNILLYGGGLQALSVAKSLKIAGYEVTVLTGDAQLDHFKYVDYLVKNDGLTLETLCETIKKFNCSAIIPMGDLNAEMLSTYKDFIEKGTGTKCATVDIETFDKANDKWKLIDFCQKNNIPCPRTLDISMENIHEAAEFVNFPAMIKPNLSVGSRGIKLVHNEQEINEHLPRIINQYGDCTLQEYVENDEFYYNVMLYRYTDGSYAQYTISKIIRFYPIKGGSSSLCYSVKDDAIANVCKKALDVLNWHGFADFDVVYNKKEKQGKIIEINPRVPASLRIAAVSGINFPEIIVNDCLGLPRKSYDYQSGKYLRYFGLDLEWFLHSPKRFTFKPSWFKFFGKDLFYQEYYKGCWRLALDNVMIYVHKFFHHNDVIKAIQEVKK